MSESESQYGCFFALDESSRTPLEDESNIEGILRCAEPVRGVRITGDWPGELHCESLAGEAGYAYRCHGKYYQSCLSNGRLRLEIRLQSDVIRALHFEIKPPDPAPFQEIFFSGFRFPERVCLIAPGPSAARHLRHIPGNFSRLAVNKAVLIPGAKADYWVMNQLTQNSLAYFTEANAMFSGTRIFRLSTAWACRENACSRSSEQCFWFMARQSPTECITDERLPALSTCVRSGATVAGCALQMLASLGASEILLCGLDMFGNQYWDGSENVETEKVGVWPHLSRMQKLIGTIQCRGVWVKHIGDMHK